LEVGRSLGIEEDVGSVGTEGGEVRRRDELSTYIAKREGREATSSVLLRTDQGYGSHPFLLTFWSLSISSESE